jgi:hypothetical protein
MLALSRKYGGPGMRDQPPPLDIGHEGYDAPVVSAVSERVRATAATLGISDADALAFERCVASGHRRDVHSVRGMHLALARECALQVAARSLVDDPVFHRATRHSSTVCKVVSYAKGEEEEEEGSGRATTRHHQPARRSESAVWRAHTLLEHYDDKRSSWSAPSGPEVIFGLALHSQWTPEFSSLLSTPMTGALADLFTFSATNGFANEWTEETRAIRGAVTEWCDAVLCPPLRLATTCPCWSTFVMSFPEGLTSPLLFPDEAFC